VGHLSTGESEVAILGITGSVIGGTTRTPVEPEGLAAGSGEHVVRFYEHEAELVQTVGGYLGGVAKTGAAVIVIATEAHRRAFEAELKASGVDVATGRADGTLIWLDAERTMAAFVHQGQVNYEEFRQVIGSRVRRAGATGRPVVAYGEMVALLWEAGDVLAAIDLEKSWNELSREVPFALLCGYRTDSVLGHEHAEALQQVCALHSSVLQPPGHEEPDALGVSDAEVATEFSAQSNAPCSARHFVAQTLRGWGHAGSLLDDAQLLVTELATNAVLHARSSFSVVVRSEGAGVRISVLDRSRVTPIMRDPDPLASSGHGLRLVDALAVNWGVEPNGGGKTVWAELRPD
jgi:anti-sigma regulatory factor (Ser/Thr protein kinase)